MAWELINGTFMGCPFFMGNELFGHVHKLE